jgi:hypothetical protein
MKYKAIFAITRLRLNGNPYAFPIKVIRQYDTSKKSYYSDGVSNEISIHIHSPLIFYAKQE